QRKYKEGECTLRVKGDMTSVNHVMRDSILFRISYAPHFIHKDKYCVWPLYDFENAIEDCKYGVTHVMRSIEFGKMRGEFQNHLKDLLGYKKQIIKEYGRFTIQDAETQGRVIRGMIEKGEVTGWDDPRLVTLKALRRRGIVRETYYELVYQAGLSPAPTTIDWTILSSINRSILDKQADRYFFVEDPAEIEIAGAPEQTVTLKRHPDLPEKGDRTFETHTLFYIAGKDNKVLKEGDLVRLMDCLNLTRTKTGFQFASLGYKDYQKKGRLIIHWLPKIPGLVSVEILMPDHHVRTGLGEPGIAELSSGTIVQFPRVGFCRLDAKEGNVYKFIFTHE
ncbi:hypothetical protein COY95_02835, partial [Candidatus Woesearchaeota archaeon CG_4_10_14_0_8_um_filter_47_5]